MQKFKNLGAGLLLAFLWIIFQQTSAFAYQINDQLSIGGVAAGLYQYERLADAPGFESEGRAALTCEPEIAYAPTDRDELFAKFGIGAGDGLMGQGRSPFALAPYGGNVEDDYININGRSRDYLLTAWYKHTFTFGSGQKLGLTAGIIDATDYMDENAYANDEFTQFFNQALINGPNAILPSYDVGGAIEWQMDRLSVKGVAMAVGTNGEDGEFESPYNFYGIQLGYRVDSGPGEGNYRMMLNTTSRDFSNVNGEAKERQNTLLFSFDQQLGEILGGWLRFGWKNDDAATLYSDLYSGGLNISGALWGRQGDNMGIGYARIGGGNKNVNHTDVFEIYTRVAFMQFFAVTGDIQYMKDSVSEGESPEGWIFGLRLTMEF